MNIRILRRDLAVAIREICKDYQLKQPLSDESSDFTLTGISVFEQKEPPPRLNSDHSIHPFIVVKATGGKVTEQDTELGNIVLVIATWDDDGERGEDDVLSIIDRIKDHFLCFPILSDMFSCQIDMSYELAEEQPQPYWYATLTMTWEIPKMNLMQGAEYV